ncbi:hypothetical protein BCR36DRAFT_253680, partial [Piromyces finnis]
CGHSAGDKKCSKNECCLSNGKCQSSFLENGCSSQEGCQVNYGLCKIEYSLIEERCGNGFGHCKEGYCCSFDGYCGTSSDFCGVGCQQNYGIC